MRMRTDRFLGDGVDGSLGGPGEGDGVRWWALRAVRPRLVPGCLNL